LKFSHVTFHDSRPAANGAEPTSHAILDWADERRILWRYIQSGELVQNELAESFNARLRDELLNEI